MFQLAAEEHVLIAAPAHTVWEYRLNFTNLPTYNPSASEVVRVNDGSGVAGPAGVGAAYEFVLNTDFGPHRVTLTVTDLIVDRVVSAEMNAGLVARELFRVEPYQAAGKDHSRVSLTLWLDLPEELEQDTTTPLLEGGRSQVRDELDAMERILSAP
ncbi:MAG: SRPBCC family protein [Acidimicrobiales bacterium]|jgi:hypothetical protein